MCFSYFISITQLATSHQAEAFLRCFLLSSLVYLYVIIPKNLQEKNQFEWKYLGFYLGHYPEYAWVAIENDKVLGYVLGMPWTQDPTLYEIQPHLKAFENFYPDFPAHLHINCHSQSRGKGIGKILVQKCLGQMSENNIRGLHIMTGPASDNRVFYQRLGFNFVKELNSILFMGIRI